MKFTIKTLMLIAVLVAIISIPLRAVVQQKARADLVMAVERGDLNKVEKLLEIHDVNTRIPGFAHLDSNSSLLITAAKSSNVEMVRFLLEHGADPTIRDNGGYAAIHYVAKNYNTYHDKYTIHDKSLEDLKRDLEVLNELVEVCPPQLKLTGGVNILVMARHVVVPSKQHQELYGRKIQILEEWMNKTKVSTKQKQNKGPGNR